MIRSKVRPFVSMVSVVCLLLIASNAAQSQIISGSEPDSKASTTLDLSGSWVFYGARCDSREKLQALKVSIDHQGSLLSITLDDECKDNKWYTGSTWISGHIPQGLAEGHVFTLNALEYNKRNGAVTRSSVMSSYLYDNGNLIVTQSSNWKYVRYFYRVK